MKSDRKLFQSLALILQFGLYMIIPIVLCTLLGVWLGRKFDIMWIVIPLFIVGALAGFNNIFRVTKSIFKDDGKAKN